MKHPKLTVYPMQSQLRLLIDLFTVGEGRVFVLEHLACNSLFVHLAGGVVPSIDTVYRDQNRFDQHHVEHLHGLMGQQGLVEVGELANQRDLLEIDTTVVALFGSHIEGTAIGYNPNYQARPSYDSIVGTALGRAHAWARSFELETLL